MQTLTLCKVSIKAPISASQPQKTICVPFPHLFNPTEKLGPFSSDFTEENGNLEVSWSSLCYVCNYICELKYQ
ncbi:hypothetical protein DsansV1_C25g0186881 [Dioscorea sansibarensis]